MISLYSIVPTSEVMDANSVLDKWITLCSETFVLKATQFA
jgi:hypothetical protein